MIAKRCAGPLRPDDPSPITITNPDGRSSFLLTGDHAGCLVPAALGSLGVAPADLHRHIGWDIGISALGRLLADRLDAVFVEQAYSRLVIDCNRDPARADAVLETSDGTAIPGNVGLSSEDRQARIAAIFDPYHRAVSDRLRDDTILIALHSFTPVMRGQARPWDVGVLHGRGNAAFAMRLLQRLRAMTAIHVGDNEPYRMDDTDYTVPRHAFPRGLSYAEIEVRQDRIADPAGQRLWADILMRSLSEADRDRLI